MNDKIIQWHPAFAAAMDLELRENRKNLEYNKEYNLNTKPLEVDLLIIKKDKDSQIVNEIGKLFRGNNIIEYKSPEDSLDIDMFYKAGAYASLYKSYGKTVDERKADDITVSIFREIKPAGLFTYFKSHNIKITNPYSGIYYVMDSVLFPTQIIVGRELDKKSHVWLRALSGQMREQEMKDLLENIERLKLKLDKELADSVLEVSIRANWEIIKELRRDKNMCQALLEIMEPEIDKIKNQIKNETKIRMIIELGQEDGLSDDVIIERLQKKTGVPYEKAKAYLEQYGRQLL